MAIVTSEIHDGELTVYISEGFGTPTPLTDDKQENLFRGCTFTPEQIHAIEKAIEEAYHSGYYEGKNEIRLEMKQAFSNFFNEHF